VSSPVFDDVRSFVISYLLKAIEKRGRPRPDVMPDDFDFLLEGAIDSLGMLELTATLEERYERPIDLEELDAEEMTVLGPFCRFVAKQISTT
jgi:acyl carrier protein